MNKFLGFVLSVFVVLNGWGGATVFAEEGITVEQETPTVSKKQNPGKEELETAWRERLSDLKSQRNTLYFFGVGGAVAGVALFASGYQDNQNVKDTPGCSQSGTTVTCNDQKSTEEAQDKLDKSFQKMVIGDVAIIAGAGLIVWGVFRGKKARHVERDGKSKGYTVDMRPKKNGMTLVLNKAF